MIKQSQILQTKHIYDLKRETKDIKMAFKIISFKKHDNDMVKKEEEEKKDKHKYIKHNT